MIAPRRATLLVPSCDRYADVWRPFFALLRRNWPDCPFRVVLGTNHRVCDEPGVETLRIGDDRDWTAGVRAMLDQTASDTVLVMLEDYLLRSRVDTGALLARLAPHIARLSCVILITAAPETSRGASPGDARHELADRIRGFGAGCTTLIVSGEGTPTPPVVDRDTRVIHVDAIERGEALSL